jgi:hypothetical protein
MDGTFVVRRKTERKVAPIVGIGYAGDEWTWRYSSRWSNAAESESVDERVPDVSVD